nr:MAG TPA: hypothetical protein [Caudoviricetes sp.]
MWASSHGNRRGLGGSRRFPRWKGATQPYSGPNWAQAR